MDLRQRVIDAATESFSMFGYKGTTMEQVARIANVGKGTIYTFFDSKESLFSTILSDLLVEMKAVAEERIQPSQTFFQNLSDTLEGLLQFRQQHHLFVKLSQEVRELGTPTVKQGLERVETTIVQYIAAHLQRAVDQGELKPCKPDIVAFMMLKTYTSLVTDWSQSRPPLSDDDIRTVFNQVFATGLEP